MSVVEQVRVFWRKWIPDWLPIVLAIGGFVWSDAQWHQHMDDKIESIEHQIQDIQQYLRSDHDHQKGFLQTPQSALQSQPEDAVIPPLTR